MTGPGDEMEAAAGGSDDLRASHADREQVIDTVKAAFTRGQLTMGELDARVGRALVARTYAELAAVTVGIPAGSDLAGPSKPARAQLRRPGNRPINPGVCVITAATLAAGVWAGMVAGPAGGTNRGDLHAEPRSPRHASVTSVPDRSVAWADEADGDSSHVQQRHLAATTSTIASTLS